MLVRIDWTESPSFEAFVQGLHERNLQYYCSDIQELLDITDFHQLEEPIRRAMEVCRREEIALEEHFKPIYRCRESNTLRDWKLSGLGYCLVLLNCSPSHPTVARMQLALVQRGFEY